METKPENIRVRTIPHCNIIRLPCQHLLPSVTILQIPPRIYGHLPKMLRLKLAHCFLWELVHGHERKYCISYSVIVCLVYHGIWFIVSLIHWIELVTGKEAKPEETWRNSLSAYQGKVTVDNGWINFETILNVTPISVLCKLISFRYNVCNFIQLLYAKKYYIHLWIGDNLIARCRLYDCYNYLDWRLRRVFRR